MPDGVQDLRSLPLYDIIGAPISAMVQAEAQAAQTTLEFIEKVGFEKLADSTSGDTGDTSALDAGMLRMVEFGYIKPDADGNPAEFVARIPLLALLPIPGIRIKLAKLNFSAKISDVFTESSQSSQTGEGEGNASWLQGGSGVQFRGSLASTSGSEQTVSSSYDLNISVELEQTPLTPGMAKLINLLDQAISDTQKLPDAGSSGTP